MFDIRNTTLGKNDQAIAALPFTNETLRVESQCAHLGASATPCMELGAKQAARSTALGATEKAITVNNVSNKLAPEL